MQLNKIPRITMTLFFFFAMFHIDLSAQMEPQPCDDPDNNGIGCYCETAGILCTPDELDGFEFSMSEVANTGGLSGDLCPELSDGGLPHNVNFFAFVVWCEELTFDVLVNFCEQGTITGPNIVNFGIQMALFANCPASDGGGWNTVECVTNGSEACFSSEAEVPTLQTFSATGLEIGATYYFMVDGCFSSTCKITIDVQGACGNGEIKDWDTGLTGPTTVCVGDTETYIAEDALDGLDGAEEYYYYLDGVLLMEGEEIYNLDITWDTPGSYELCVDVSNLPCIPESDMPSQNCITVIVSGPGNGDITADPAILCPDETSIISVNNNTDPQFSNYIIIVGPDGTAIQVVEGLSTMLTYNMCGDFTAHNYSFITSQNPTIPEVGDVWILPNCLADCCTLEEVDISFVDDEVPVFILEPDDIILDCADDIDPDESLIWTDNCAGTGMVTPTVDENFTLCDGGTVVRTWSFTDSCAHHVEHIQTITIDPIPLPVFTTLPGDSIIDCETAQFFVPLDLEYTNSAGGTCDITGIVSPTSVGTIDLCGSSITYTWKYTDMCNRTIIWSQVVTVQEIAVSYFINPPSDKTITCEEWLTFMPEILNYSNDQSGACEISGSVLAVSSDSQEPCGNDITYSWEFTDVCARNITHTQVVTVESQLSSNSITKDNIKIYPNPTNNLLNIKSDHQVTSFDLYTTTGKILHKAQWTNTNNVEIDLSGYPSGLYLLQIETEKGRWLKKVVKK